MTSKTGMSRTTKINIASGAAILVVALIAYFLIAKPFAPAAGDPVTAESVAVVEPNSHRLDVADDGKVTIVEFLDFECEACGAVYPAVEELRKEYAGRVTFVFRYFPIPSHKNSTNAALAVEAAAQQDKLELMYAKLFETQSEWGESQDSQAPLFRQYAVDLGFDIAAYDLAVADPATSDRVRADFDAGVRLGVEGTPSFFVNDRSLNVQSIDDIRSALDRALAE